MWEVLVLIIVSIAISANVRVTELRGAQCVSGMKLSILDRYDLILI